VESDPSDLPLGAGFDRRHDSQEDRVPIAAGSIDSHILKRGAEKPRNVRFGAEPASQLVDRVVVRALRVVEQVSDQAVDEARRLEERRDRLEHEQVTAEDELAAPLVVERARPDVNRSAQLPWLEASSCLGVSFFGSMNGFSTTTADVLPSGRSTSSSVPRSLCSTGTIAKPMFFSSRGE
jgi:hypothetical protein